MRPPATLLLLVILLAAVSAQSKSLRRHRPQPFSHSSGPLTNRITPRAARELLEHALLYGLDDAAAAVAVADHDGPALLPPAAPGLGKTEANSTCIMEFCLDAAKDCFLDRPCRAALQCLSGCDVIEDDTPDKIILQNCTAACVVTYENAALDAVNGCFDAHDCITLDPIDLPCRDTTEAAAAQPVALMEGQWWATWGYNLVYDCYECQRLTFSPINGSAWLYNSKYVADTLDGKQRAFEVKAAFPWPADGVAQSITFTYEYQGMTHGETWKFLHVSEDVVLLYYCGISNTWNYEGALVLSRERSSPEEHLGMAAEAFARVGLAFPEQFCALDNAPCEGF